MKTPKSIRAKKRAWIWLLSAFISSVVCCRNAPATPEDALRNFLLNVRRQDAKKAWGQLSRETQSTMIEDAKAIARAAGTPERLDPETLLFEQTELVLLRQPESISIASRIGDEVVMRVSVKGKKTASVRLVKEGEAWKVDLFGSLSPMVQTFDSLVGDDSRAPEDPEARTATHAEP